MSCCFRSGPSWISLFFFAMNYHELVSLLMRLNFCRRTPTTLQTNLTSSKISKVRKIFSIHRLTPPSCQVLGALDLAPEDPEIWLEAAKAQGLCADSNTWFLLFWLFFILGLKRPFRAYFLLAFLSKSKFPFVFGGAFDAHVTCVAL